VPDRAKLLTALADGHRTCGANGVDDHSTDPGRPHRVRFIGPAPE